MARPRVRLRTRIVVWFAGLVLLQGIALATVITRLVDMELRASARRSGTNMAQRLLLQSTDSVLTGNPVALYKILRRAQAGTPEMRYAFILDRSGEVIAHTFARGIPQALLSLHPFDRPDPPRLITYAGEPAYDFSATGDWGGVRVGISLAGVEETLARVKIYAAAATGAAVIATVVLALLVSRPVERLTRFVATATAAGRRDLDPEVLGTLETSELCAAFEKVAAELREKVEELTRSENTVRGQKEYIENLHDNLGLAICVVSSSGNLEFANERARSRFAIHDPRSWIDRFTPLDEEQSSLARAVDAGQPFQGLWRAADGTVYDIKGVPIRSVEGAPSMLLRFLDVSEEIALREQLERSEKMVYVGSLAASIAHGVNNPLGAAIMKAEMLENDARRAGLPQQFLEDIEKIRALAARAGQLTQRLLLFSRHSADDFPLHKRRTDIVAIARHAATQLEDKAKARGAVLRSDHADALPELDLDPEGILHVLVNVIDNAIDAVGPGGSVHVESSRESRDDGDYIAIRVRDDGPGMSEDVMAKMFTPFFTTKDLTGGTGLGLAIADRIVRQHGGRIAVRSHPGRGTMVTILLPLDRKSEAT